MGQTTWLYPFTFFIIIILSIQFSHSMQSLSYSAHNHSCPYDQGLVLLQFKQTLQIDTSLLTLDSQPKIKSWKRGTDCCTWDGITCNGLTGHVIGLDLSGDPLRGTIGFNSSLFRLSYLKNLDLSYTSLLGKLPDSIGFLKSLNYLQLSRCKFSGSIPESLGKLKQIVDLDLSYNNFSGPLPSSFVNLTKLVTLSISHNSVAGTIPSWLFSLPSLVSLDLQSNQLTGPIEEFQYKSLESIDLGNNDLQGPIPQSISKLANLTYLYILGNNFTGIVELDKFSNIRNLRALELSYNSLSVNTNINASLPNLLVLVLSSCNLKEFPYFLQDSVDLRILDLSDNQIHGKIPQWVGNMWRHSLSNIAIIDLQSNLLEGPLPSSVCKLSTLEVLVLSNNSFYGTIPQCLGNFSDRLSLLDLRMNSFHGSIPATFVGKRLRNLNLHGNSLEGILPRSLANCSRLVFLDVGNNKINDTFPDWLETIPLLEVLVMRFNRFHGPITSTFKTELPFSELRIIDLSHNEFTGFLPSMYFKGFKAMMNSRDNEMEPEYMQSNSGDNYDYITLAMKGNDFELVRILTVFTAIDLSKNKFEGEIPNLIGNLNSLRVLNLSNNNLVGHIPLVLGNLSVLESLDLSSNQLAGQIPEQLTSLTFLAVLNLSQNHLVGRIPRGPQFSTFQNISYSGNSALCGFPMSKNCGDGKEPEAPQPSVLQQNKDNSDSGNGFTWKVVLMGYGCGLVFGLVIGYLMFLTGKPKWFTGFVEKELKRANRPEKKGHKHYRRRN